MADEVASDNELAGANLLTNVPALGAFDACREFARARGRIAKGRKVEGETMRQTYARRVFLLADMEMDKSIVTYRAALSLLTGRDLRDTKGERRHCLDAMAAGIWHAYAKHYWHPPTWADPDLARQKRRMDGLVHAIRVKTGRA
jgi:hypothetical protein